MGLNVGDQEYNGGKKYRQKGTLSGPNNGILNALATTLCGSIRTTLSIHHLWLGLLGYLIPFAPLAFVSQC
jgi:hypothetical protein